MKQYNKFVKKRVVVLREEECGCWCLAPPSTFTTNFVFGAKKESKRRSKKKNEKEEQEKLFEDEKKNAFSLSLHFLAQNGALIFFFASFF